MSEPTKSKRDPAAASGDRSRARSGAKSGVARKRLDLETEVRDRFVDFLDKCRDEIDVQRAKEEVTEDIKRVARLMAESHSSARPSSPDSGDSTP